MLGSEEREIHARKKEPEQKPGKQKEPDPDSYKPKEVDELVFRKVEEGIGEGTKRLHLRKLHKSNALQSILLLLQMQEKCMDGLK